MSRLNADVMRSRFALIEPYKRTLGCKWVSRGRQKYGSVGDSFVAKSLAIDDGDAVIMQLADVGGVVRDVQDSHSSPNCNSIG